MQNVQDIIDYGYNDSDSDLSIAYMESFIDQIDAIIGDQDSWNNFIDMYGTNISKRGKNLPFKFFWSRLLDVEKTYVVADIFNHLFELDDTISQVIYNVISEPIGYNNQTLCEHCENELAELLSHIFALMDLPDNNNSRDLIWLNLLVNMDIMADTIQDIINRIDANNFSTWDEEVIEGIVQSKWSGGFGPIRKSPSYLTTLNLIVRALDTALM